MNAEILKEQARLAEQREEWSAAIDLYTQAADELARADQPDLSLYNRLGDLEIKVGNVERAVEHYEQAIDLYLESELPNNAIAICRKIVRNVPTRHQIFLRMGQIRAKQGFLTDARHNILEYAERMQKAGDMEEAFRALGEFVDLAPEDNPARLALAAQLEAHDRTAEAVEQYVAVHQRLVSKGLDAEAAEIEGKIRELDRDAVIPPPGAAPEEFGDEMMAFEPAAPLDEAAEGLAFEPRAPLQEASLTFGEEDATEATPDTPATFNEIEFAPAAESPAELDFSAISEADLEPTGEAELATRSEETEGSGLGGHAGDGDVAEAESEMTFGDIEMGEAMTPADALEGVTFDEPSMDTWGAEAPSTPAELAFESEAEDVEDVEPLPLLTFEDEEESVEAPEEEAAAVGEFEMFGEGDVEQPAPTASDGDDEAVDVVAVGLEAEPEDAGEALALEADAGLPELHEPESDLEAAQWPATDEIAPADAEVEETVESPEEADLVLALQERLEQDPGDGDTWLALSQEFFARGRADESSLALDQALATFTAADDVDGSIRAVKTLISHEPGQVEHHQRLVELAVRKNDSDAVTTAYLDLADCLAQDGDEERARAVYQQVLVSDPENQKATAGLAGMKTRPSEPIAEVASSEDYVDLGALVLDEEDEKTTRWRVAAEEPTGDDEADFAKMLEQFKEKVAENLEVDDLAAHYDLGTAYKEMGLVDEAISEFQQALRAQSDHLPTHELLGQCFMEKGQYEVAVHSMGRALDAGLEVEDELLGIYYQMARAHEELGNKGEALEFYEKVFALDINFQDVTERLRVLR
jgi:tetratricopeptide (TPR) repeat protein